MPLDPTTFANTVIAPTLNQIGLFSPAAEQLLLGTAIQESGLAARRQFGGGPARGLFQMEPNTANDIWNNYLAFHHNLAAQITALMSGPGADRVAELENNDPYACAMCRAHYARVTAALPAAGDIAAMAAYWKQHYNTPLGAGTTPEFINNWNRMTGSAPGV